MDKNTIDNLVLRHNSEVTVASALDCWYRQTSTASQQSFCETSCSERSITDESSPTKSVESLSRISLDEKKHDKKCLNWKKYLKDEKFTFEPLRFEKNRGINQNEDPVLLKDLNRTRSDDLYFQKPSNINALKDIACFYCSSNNVHYQQGLLEIIAPFLKLRSSTFRTRHCYAYFASFMRNYFPNILTPMTVNDSTELPHLNAAVNYCEILLNYHANHISNILRVKDLDLKTFVTPWIMTLFSRGTKMELVYEIFDKYMAENDKFFMFYIVIALILLKENDIVKLHELNDDIRLITYLNRSLKNEAIQTSEDVQRLFELSKKIKLSTPASFTTLLIQTGLMDVGIISTQEYREYLHEANSKLMEVYPFEVVEYLAKKTETNANEQEDLNNKIDFRFLDCRKSKKEEILPFTLEMPETVSHYFEALKSYVRSCCELEQDTHIILLKTNDFDKEEQNFVESVIHLLRAHNKNYVSVGVGGYKAIRQEMEQRKIKIPLIKKAKPSVFGKIRSMFSKVS